MSEINICIVLTCTIDICGVALTERSDTNIRHNDYQIALRQWLKNKYVKQIIIVENSGYDLGTLRQIVDETNAGKQVEFISFDGQNFPRHLGKGYGESLALARVVSNSVLLGEADKFIKVNGRYYVPNIHMFMEKMKSDVEVMTDLSKHLLWSDSRVFGGTANFIRSYLCIEGDRVNDSQGHFMEHALARATHRAIADGMKWAPLPCTPAIDGVSGSVNIPFKNSWLRRFAKDIFIKAKAMMLSR